MSTTQTTSPTPVRMTVPMPHGACGFCGAVRMIPSHPANEIAPRPVRTCEHGS